MKKKWIILLSAIVLLVAASGVAFSASTAKLIVNGNIVPTDVPPQFLKGRTMVPIRWVAEALGAKVDWNSDTQSVTVDLPKPQPQSQQLALLEQAIVPESAGEAVKAWAEAVKTRNGAVQYALYSDSLRSQTVKTFEDLNWVTGVSSPWVGSYKISEAVKLSEKKQSYDVAIQLTSSTGNAGKGTVKVTAEATDGKWRITGLQGEGNVDDLDGIIVLP